VAKTPQESFPEIRFLAYVAAIPRYRSQVNPETVTFPAKSRRMWSLSGYRRAAGMIERIKQVRSEGDSVGGVLEGVIRRAPPGLGEPVFDKLEADLAKAMLSLPATKGFEIGSGFAGSRLKGSEHNDAFRMKGTRVRTLTNFSGGIQGGISNGEPLVFRVAFKPTATIAKPQQTVTVSGENAELAARGRHDPCVLPRAVPMVEAMAALVLCDHALRQRAQDCLPR
jgi:chorismate synthase